MWREVVEGPATRLAERLDAADWPSDRTRPVLEAYLKFAAEAVGLGYIYPSEEAGRENFFNLAWFDLLPERLTELEPERQIEVLSACWNLGESLETRPAWIQHLFMEEADRLEALGKFEERVDAITRKILGEPGAKLDRDADPAAATRIFWVYFGEAYPRFLPGRVEFLAPGVACVHHRHEGLEGQPKTSVGVSLVGEPEFLGTMRVDAPTEEADAAEGSWWEQVASTDERITKRYATAANDWRAICALDTSQYVVAVLPAEERTPRDGEGADRVVLGLDE